MRYVFCVCVSVCYTLFVPWGTNISHTQERRGTNISHTQEGAGDKHFCIEGGGQTFFVGGHDDVDEEMDVS